MAEITEHWMVRRRRRRTRTAAACFVVLLLLMLLLRLLPLLPLPFSLSPALSATPAKGCWAQKAKWWVLELLQLPLQLPCASLVAPRMPTIER